MTYDNIIHTYNKKYSTQYIQHGDNSTVHKTKPISACTYIGRNISKIPIANIELYYQLLVHLFKGAV